MGHENISTTLDIYGHLYPDAQHELTDCLNTFLLNSLLQEIFTHELNGEKINKSSISKFTEILSQKDLYIKNSEYFDDIIKSENIREYVKKI